MLRNNKNGVRKMHRTSGESSTSRARKKLTGKSEWFRKAGKSNQPETPAEKETQQAEKILNHWLEPAQVASKPPSNTKTLETRTVLFVETSRGGELAKRLRAVERRTNNIVGFKTKIVKGVGTKLKDLLPNTNPWKGVSCGREKCIPCNQPGER